MRGKPISWLPFDSRFLPLDFTLKTPQSPFVKALLALEIILAIISVLGSLLLVFWPNQSLNLVPRQSFCQERQDCVLGIRIDQCCDCPGAYLKEEIEADQGLTIYEPRKDFRLLKPRSCRQIYCPACPFYDKAYCCSGGSCQGMALPRIVSK